MEGKMRRLMSVILIMSVVLLLSSCGKPGKQTLAKVDDRVITLEDFNKRIDRLPQQYQEIVKGQRKKFLEDLIMEGLLYKEALRSNIESDPEIQEVIFEAKKKILISRLMKDRVNNKVSISEDDIKTYYDEHSEEFMLPERWRASHILVDTLEAAQEIKSEHDQGASFEVLAKERSKDATARQGGDIGYFSKGQLIPEFEEACFQLEVGEVSDIVKSQFGYHIIMLKERKSPEVQEYSKVKDIIKKELEREKARGLLEELTADLRTSAKIVINEKLLEEIAEEESRASAEIEAIPEIEVIPAEHEAE
jgi:peptidyl-prolyl cis-trans isomerase C